MAILDDNEFVEVEGRAYANPQVALDESNSFIDNLRSTQQANNQQIQTQTYNLGTEVPSSLGGLTSPSGDVGLSYFTSRYQVPQTEAVVANLRATAQAAALNDVLANEQAIWKKRYQDAYRNYQKSAYNRSYSGGGSSSNKSSTENTSTWDGESELKTTDGEGNEQQSQVTPPNPYSDEFNITGEEQTKRISERSGLPESLVNVLKIFGNT